MSKKEITITIQTGRGSEAFTFNQTTKIEDVIKQVIEKFGYQSGNFSLVFGTEVLTPERPLVSYHFNGETVLQLSDTGGGV